MNAHMVTKSEIIQPLKTKRWLQNAEKTQTTPLLQHIDDEATSSEENHDLFKAKIEFKGSCLDKKDTIRRCKRQTKKEELVK